MAFIVNGKSDGSTRGDAGTQVMGGLIGSALHPRAERALVIGLGTGSTAGWLAAVPTMKRVDVVEIEPEVIRVAGECAAVNRDVLRRTNVVVTIADARESLLTSRATYDVIFSEPSNPYRAGVASLFTAEFYAAVASRLGRNGIFLQWVQAYDIDNETVRTIYATLGSVFPHITTWHTGPGDLLLSASAEPIAFDADVLRRRLAAEPYRSAMHVAWRVEDLEGFLSRHIANPGLAAALGAQSSRRNTDDRTLIEFDFERSVGRDQFRIDQLVDLATRRGASRPAIRGAIDWDRVARHIASDPLSVPDAKVIQRHQFGVLHRRADLGAALAAWKAAPFDPVNTLELSELAEAFAEEGSEEAIPLADRLRGWQPAEADAILARMRLAQKRYGEAADLWPALWFATEAIRGPAAM